MKEERYVDPAKCFQDDPFPGKNEIALSVGVIALVMFLPELVFNTDKLPQWTADLRNFVTLAAIPFYFIGFWKAVRGKGYAAVLFLISFVPIIGLIIIVFLPILKESGADS